VNPIKFLQEVRAELKQVVWPTREEATRLSSIVIAVSVIMGLFLGGLDYLLTQLTKVLIGS
jgi:preprotein translocase subunit SecE